MYILHLLLALATAVNGAVFFCPIITQQEDDEKIENCHSIFFAPWPQFFFFCYRSLIGISLPATMKFFSDFESHILLKCHFYHMQFIILKQRFQDKPISLLHVCIQTTVRNRNKNPIKLILCTASAKFNITGCSICLLYTSDAADE